MDVHVPLLSRGRALGRVRARVVDYLPDAVSSFELNEHLAKIDDAPPLAPNPRGRTRKPIARAANRTIEPEPQRDARRRIGRDADAPDESTWWYGGPITPQPPTPQVCTPGGFGPVPSESPAKPAMRTPRRIPRNVSGKENETNVATLPSSSTLRLVDRRRLEAKRSKARALAAVERERVNDSDGFGFKTAKSTGTDRCWRRRRPRDGRGASVRRPPNAPRRIHREFTRAPHATDTRGDSSNRGTDGEEDEGLEGRATASATTHRRVARESTASDAAAAAWLREDDDAARVADEALLEELFFAETGAFDVNDDEDEGEEATPRAAPSPETTAVVARASACSSRDEHPEPTPDVEIVSPRTSVWFARSTRSASSPRRTPSRSSRF